MIRRGFLGLITAPALIGATVAHTPQSFAGPAFAAKWAPTRHPQDDWLDQIPGKHRLLFDTSTAVSMDLAIRFAENYFRASREGYGLKDSDLAVLIVLRHKSTSFGYNDAIWAKYGKHLADSAELSLAKRFLETPKANPYLSRPGGSMRSLIERGAHFAVCGISTDGIAGKIAAASGGNAASVRGELSDNLVEHAHMVPAGVVAVNRAQERGYSFLTQIER